MNENIVTGKKYRILKDEIGNIWDRISFWTKASDVEFNDGANLEAARNAINTSIGNMAPKNHAESTTNSSTAYGTAAASTFGHVKIADEIPSNTTPNSKIAASINAVNAAIVSALQTVNRDFAPKDHSSTATTYGKATDTKYGHIKLSDVSVGDESSSASTGIGASAKSVYDLGQRTQRTLASLSNQVSVGSTNFYFDVQGGKYGYNTSSSRGASTFHPFDSLESGCTVVAHAEKIYGESATQVTVVKGDWYLIATGGMSDAGLNRFSGLDVKCSSQAQFNNTAGNIFVSIGKSTGTKLTFNAPPSLNSYAYIVVKLGS